MLTYKKCRIVVLELFRVHARETTLSAAVYLVFRQIRKIRLSERSLVFGVFSVCISIWAGGG